MTTARFAATMYHHHYSRLAPLTRSSVQSMTPRTGPCLSSCSQVAPRAACSQIPHDPACSS
ncbi:hypothetical protein BD779DRAFT_473419 [Infundibulicybe gibba]|nr:hypothetical protein BD779DRAFT_473419 [Infundibulicybe gibba]